MAPVIEFAEHKQRLLEELSKLILGDRTMESEFEAVLEAANKVCDRYGLQKAA
jgi:hypothetical protein